ncbi:MAG: AAA family ATPase [Acidobacteriota bacterium]|nr:AAA family ATPase [Acidobacteriota bacterium]
MRLDKLKIDHFKNLREFEIDFDQESPTTVIVGRNGTGKSNLLEALVIIFRDLDLGERPSFKYELQYFCRNHKVQVDADPARERNAVEIRVDDEPISNTRFSQDSTREYFPNFVFGYYSGSSNRLEQHFEKHQKNFKDDLLKNVERPLRPLFYARLVHSQFVLLSFFTDENDETFDLLEEHLRIKDLDSALFIMKKPDWKGDKTKGDPRFWYARGVVSTYLDKLYELALAPMRLNPSRSEENLYLYLQNTAALRKLAGSYPNQQEFFKALESTYISDLISEVRIRVHMSDADGSLTFRELSEGEQQLLMVLGLLRFTKEDESLFLLDEPDTHLNPAWGLRYLELISAFVGDQQSSHILIATHDPLVIAGLEREQVQLLQRDEETGRIGAGYPEESPRGMGVAALLTSDIYGLRSQLDLPTLRLLDERRELAIKEKLTDTDRSRLRDLNEELDRLDFTTTTRDPLYEPYIKAMTKAEKEEGLREPVLTPEQQERQKELAVQIVRELKSTESEGND